MPSFMESVTLNTVRAADRRMAPARARWAQEVQEWQLRQQSIRKLDKAFQDQWLDTFESKFKPFKALQQKNNAQVGYKSSVQELLDQRGGDLSWFFSKKPLVEQVYEAANEFGQATDILMLRKRERDAERAIVNSNSPSVSQEQRQAVREQRRAVEEKLARYRREKGELRDTVHNNWTISEPFDFGDHVPLRERFTPEELHERYSKAKKIVAPTAHPAQTMPGEWPS